MWLSNATLDRLPATVARPAYDRSAIRTGIVHLGPGAFFRAHVASYIDDLLVTDPRWGICAVSLHSRDVRDALAPQDWLYTLTTLGEPTGYRVIGALTDVLCAADQPEAVHDILAAPATRLVTLTITEKGYAGGAPPAISLLVEAHRRRRAAGVPALTMLSCDNLTGNGARLRDAVVRFAAVADPDLAAWIAAEARFPATMVDSITPATDDALRTTVAAALGMIDAWPVQREPFRQWVTEPLGPDMPDLAAVGADIGGDVEVAERAKLRLLNGAHSTLAWLGLLLGHTTVAEAMTDPPLARFIERLMCDEIAPTLGSDRSTYIDTILTRFANPGIRHELAQIAWDSSQKLPFRLLGTVADTLAAGRSPGRLAVAVAAWLRFVAARTMAGIPLIDPLAADLAAASGPEALLALASVFPPLLAADPRFRDAVLAAYAGLADPRDYLEGLDR